MSRRTSPLSFIYYTSKWEQCIIGICLLKLILLSFAGRRKKLLKLQNDFYSGHSLEFRLKWEFFFEYYVTKQFYFFVLSLNIYHLDIYILYPGSMQINLKSTTLYISRLTHQLILRLDTQNWDQSQIIFVRTSVLWTSWIPTEFKKQFNKVIKHKQALVVG